MGIRWPEREERSYRGTDCNTGMKYERKLRGAGLREAECDKKKMRRISRAGFFKETRITGGGGVVGVWHHQSCVHAVGRS